jgi:L-alanine-DL-glutamate epimerase-like enolase superfamily enzyme
MQTRIERAEVVPYALPFKEPYVTARGRLDRRELVLVRLHAGALEGLGETTALTLRGGDALIRIAADLARGGSLLEGIEFDSRRWAEPAERLRSALSAQALAAFETALLDLAGKLDGEPAWRLLGADVAHPVECNATLTAGTPEEVARQAVAWANWGFRTFKLKVGVDGDVEQVSAARDALGPDARLRVDANGVWSIQEAVERLRRMTPLELAEQPVATLAEMAEVRAQTDVPICADESVETPEQARSAAASCDVATVKIAKVGGLRAALEVARWLPVYLSSALDGPVGIAAAAHLAQALPDAGFAHGLATSLLFAETVGRGAELDGRLLTVPEGPGLGVEIDEGAIARHRLTLG